MRLRRRRRVGDADGHGPCIYEFVLEVGACKKHLECTLRRIRTFNDRRCLSVPTALFLYQNLISSLLGPGAESFIQWLRLDLKFHG